MDEYEDNNFDEYDEQNHNNELNNLIEEEFIPKDETDEIGDFLSFSPELDEYRRIKVDNNIIKSVINDLKNRNNYSQKKISEIIGTNIKNIYYNYTETMNEGSFKKLEELVGKKLKHKIIEKKNFTYKRNESLAEFIGIMLGDGHLNKEIYRQQISFNGVDEYKYMQYVKNKINTMFKINSKERWERNQKNATGYEKGMFLYIDNKNIFNELISHGLKSGNKVKNQVGVPDWIKKEKCYILSCLKGLFDTDGSISVVKKDHH